MELGNKSNHRVTLPDNYFYLSASRILICLSYRTQSVILIGTNNEVLFYERTMEGSDWLENKYEFTIETPM